MDFKIFNFASFTKIPFCPLRFLWMSISSNSKSCIYCTQRLPAALWKELTGIKTTTLTITRLTFCNTQI